MSEQIYREKSPEQEPVEDIAVPEIDQEAKTDQDAELDDLIKEIDDLIETDPEEFVSQFQQRGGQ